VSGRLFLKALPLCIKPGLYDNRPSPDRIVIEAKDITQGAVYEKNGVEVTKLEVDHKLIKPAFGYRIDYAGRSVVLFGDTRFSENLIKYAERAGCIDSRSSRAGSEKTCQKQ
jgi:ribonuclease Z